MTLGSKFLAFALIFSIIPAIALAEDHSITSPNGAIEVVITADETLHFSISHQGTMVIPRCDIAMEIKDTGVLGTAPKVLGVEKSEADEILRPAVKVRSAEIRNRYNQISIRFDGGYSVEFRAFDGGIAYRFVTAYDNKVFVVDETFHPVFADNYATYFPEEESFLTHSERLYLRPALEDIKPEQMCSMPMLVEAGGLTVAITESDLYDYPGMYLRGCNDRSLHSKFPAVATKENQPRDRTVEVVERAPYIAETAGTRSFPWRIVILADEDGDLLENQMVYALARPLEIEDTSWIRPGKVAWDWWNYNNVYGVDFRAGVNTDTYKYYIDFASKYGIEYIILDEGWYELWDLHKINPEIDMPGLLAYAESKNVGIILWVVWKTLEDQMEMFDIFEQWGVKGIKVDFMQRDDQWMVNYYWKIAREAAKRKLLVDFHGSYKPSGLRRAYPNVITREGVCGLEHYKWDVVPTPEHNTILPFTRMLAGPMDYTPGAMINSQKENFHPIFKRPMSMTTRCHQLGLYVIFESPLQMLADSPSHYLDEPECMEFLAAVPTVWDETRVLAAKISDYVILARRSGDDWYVGAIGDEEAREFEIDLSFLGDGEWTMLEYRDGINADRYASDFAYEKKAVSAGTALKIKLAPAGGWAARFIRSDR